MNEGRRGAEMRGILMRGDEGMRDDTMHLPLRVLMMTGPYTAKPQFSNHVAEPIADPTKNTLPFHHLNQATKQARQPSLAQLSSHPIARQSRHAPLNPKPLYKSASIPRQPIPIVLNKGTRKREPSSFPPRSKSTHFCKTLLHACNVCTTP